MGLNLCDLRVAAPIDGAWRPSDSLTEAERVAVLAENARRGVLHLVKERTEEETLHPLRGRARPSDGRSQMMKRRYL